MMATTAVPFLAPHPLDRNFFLAFVVISWIGIAFGFFPASSARIMGHADYVAPPILHLHAASFVGWMALFTAQNALIRTRRTMTHRKLGAIAVLLVPIMAYSGIAAEFYSQRFYVRKDDTDLAFLILPLFYIAGFTAFTTAALMAARRDPAAHKRLMLLGTTVIVGAAYARWWGAALMKAFGDDFVGLLINSFTGTNLILAAAIAFDIATRRRLHRAYWIGALILLTGELVCSWIYHAPWWPPIARILIQTPLPLST